MALDTNNNFVVTGYTGEANVATDYSLSETSHFQVVKMAYGSTAEEPIRVTDSTPLPVDIMNNPSVTATVSGSASVTNNVAVHGIVGATAVGVTASDFDIRNLTAGTVTAGDPSTSTIDMVRVIGYSGGYPVGVTAIDLDIRNLTAGSVTAGEPSTSTVDIVRVIGYSGGYPIGVSAIDLDIRNLTSASDSVSVFGGVTVSNGEGVPFDAFDIFKGFQTRLLRASTNPDPNSNFSNLISYYLSSPSLEDTVRVVGLSGAYPVDVALMGFTNINNRSTRLPLNVDSTGALFVNLAAGTIGVTATISGSNFTLVGVSLADATAAKETIQIRGYTGTGAIPIGVTATDLDIRNLSASTDAVYAQTRLLGSSGTDKDLVDLNGTAGNAINKLLLSFAPVVTDAEYRIKTDDVQAATIKNTVSEISINTSNIDTNFTNALNTNQTAVRVEVTSVAQPTGMTSGKIAAPINSSAATQMGSAVLQSGVHFKSDLSNTSGTIFVGSNGGVTGGNGYPLYNGDQIFIETDNTNKIFISATVAGLTLYYIGT